MQQPVNAARSLTVRPFVRLTNSARRRFGAMAAALLAAALVILGAPRSSASLLPVINSSLSVTGAYGVAISPYQITVLNLPIRPVFGCTGLPAGLSVDAATGEITGIPKTNGVFGLTLSVSNILVSATASLSLTLAKAPLSVSNIIANNKVYDGTTNASLNFGSASITGILGSDVISLNTGSVLGHFTGKNVGTNKTVTVTGLIPAGAAAANYLLSQPVLSANISAAPLTVSGISAVSRAYDSTLAVALDNSGASLAGVILGDLVSLNTATASALLSDPNAGIGKIVNVSGLSINGADAANYVLSQPVLTTTITKALAALNLGSLYQVYDGAALTVGTLTSPAGLGWNLTYNGLSAPPTNAGSYTVSAIINDLNYQGGSTNIFTIAQAVLTAIASDATRPYGQTNPIFSGTLSGAIAGDALSLSFNSPAATNSQSGNYPIIPVISDPYLKLGNYALTSSNGTLVVTAVPLVLSIQSMTDGPQTGLARVSSPAEYNRTYTIQVSTNLATGLWTDLTNVTANTFGFIEFYDPATSQFHHRFFRAKTAGN